MTQLGRICVVCPLCQGKITCIGYHSINPNMDPDIILELLEHPPQTECPNCKKQIPLLYHTNIVALNHFQDFYTGASYEEKFLQFVEWKLINEEGKLIVRCFPPLSNNQIDTINRKEGKYLADLIESFALRIKHSINEQNALDSFDREEWQKLHKIWQDFIGHHPQYQENHPPPPPPKSPLDAEMITIFQQIRKSWNHIHFLENLFK
jgi:hypothetical protein